jgi:hypothetical protein
MKWKARLGAAAIGLYASSFLINGWLFCVHKSCSARVPRPELGMLYRYNNWHLTAEEATAMNLLLPTMVAAAAAVAPLVPKRPGPLDPPAPIDATREQKLMVLVSASIWLTSIYFAGPHIVHFALSRGITLSF